MHFLRQTAHIMMALDDLSRNVQAFYAVGIDGSLCQPLCIRNLLRLSVEHLNEVASDNLTLLLRVGHTSQVGKELGTSINTYNIQSQHLIVFHHLLELVLAQHAVINEDTSEAIANGSIQQNSSHAGVHTTRKTKNHTVFAQLLFQLSHRGINKRSGTPILLGTADVNHKILQQERTLNRVEHFRMELHSPNALVIGESRVDNICRATNHMKTFRNSRYGISMTHPHLRIGLETAEKRIFDIYILQMGATILTRVGLFHLSTIGKRDELGAITNAQNRHFAHKL